MRSTVRTEVRTSDRAGVLPRARANRRPVAELVLAAMLAVGLVACGSAGAAAPAGGAGAPGAGEAELARAGVDQPSALYCRLVVDGAPLLADGESSAVAIRTYWDARRVFEHRALVASPAVIAPDWAAVAAFTRDELTPAIEALEYVVVPDIDPPDGIVGSRVRIAAVDEGCRAAT